MKSKEWNEIRVETDAQLQAKLRDMRQELFNLRLQQESARLERPSRMREVRRNIARIETLLRERQLSTTAASK